MRAFEKELDKKFGVDRDKGTDKGVAQLAKHIERLFHRKANARFHISALDELLVASHTRVEKVTPLLIVQEPFLRFHIIEDLLNVRFCKLLRKKKVSNAITVGPLAVLDIDTLEQMKANIAAGDFTLAQCLNARAHRDPEYKQFWPEFISDHFEQFGKRDDTELNAKFSEIMDRTRKRFLEMEAKIIIERFINEYNTCQLKEYHISRWPDEENRNQRDIDAFAEANGVRPLAIEHTKVETFFNQLQDAARFGEYYGN